MAGRLITSTLNDDTGVLATQNGMRGIAKAWVNFDGATGNIYGTPFNVSSITRIGTGRYQINFTTAMPNANYSAVNTVGNYNNGDNFNGVFNNSRIFSTTSYRFDVQFSGNTYFDAPSNCVAVFSS